MTADLRAGKLDLAILLTEGIVAELHHNAHSKILATYVRTPLTWGVHVHHALGAASGVRALPLRADVDFTIARLAASSRLCATNVSVASLMPRRAEEREWASFTARQ